MMDPVPASSSLMGANVGECNLSDVKLKLEAARNQPLRSAPKITGFLGKGIGLRTCFFDMVEPTSTVVDPTVSLGGKTLAVDLAKWLEDPTGRGEHKHPHLKFLVSCAMFLLRRNVRLVFVLPHAGPKPVEDAVPLLAALGCSWVRARKGESVTPLCVALEQLGLADGIITSTPEVFLYGARVVYKATSFCSLREGRMLEYRADSLHDALGGADTDPELTHRRLVAFAALVGCERSGGNGLRLSPSKAIEFLRAVPEGDDPLDALHAWADASGATLSSPSSVAAAPATFAEPAAGARPLGEQAEGAYVKGASMVHDLCGRATVPRRPNLEMLLDLHASKPLIGLPQDRQETALQLKRDCLSLCARLEVVHPGLLPPHPHVDPRNLAAGPKPASHVFPAAFAPSTATREGRRKLRAELPDGDAVRVLWKVQGGRSFSTVESKAAFTAVYPMLKQQNWANTYQLRGLLGY